MSLTEAGGALTKTPQNVVVLRGEDALLHCSTNATTGGNSITWYYDHDIITHRPCTSQATGFVTSTPDLPTYATQCNLRALGTRQDGISGAYRCDDLSPSSAVAMVIVLGEWCY